MYRAAAIRTANELVFGKCFARENARVKRSEFDGEIARADTTRSDDTRAGLMSRAAGRVILAFSLDWAANVS